MHAAAGLIACIRAQASAFFYTVLLCRPVIANPMPAAGFHFAEFSSIFRQSEFAAFAYAIVL